MFRQHFVPEKYTESLASTMYKLNGWKCLERKDWDSWSGVGIIHDWPASGGEGKMYVLEMGKLSKSFISFKTMRSCEFPSSPFLQCPDRLDPVQISALLGIWTGITCLLFPLVGCVLGCQQLRWRCWWREGWEPWPRADLPEHPVPEGDYVQYPLPAVADEAEAEGAQVKVPAQRFSGSLTVTVLSASGVLQFKMECLRAARKVCHEDALGRSEGWLKAAASEWTVYRWSCLWCLPVAPFREPQHKREQEIMLWLSTTKRECQQFSGLKEGCW